MFQSSLHSNDKYLLTNVVLLKSIIAYFSDYGLNTREETTKLGN